MVVVLDCLVLLLLVVLVVPEALRLLHLRLQ
jgi:hypothetical protein